MKKILLFSISFLFPVINADLKLNLENELDLLMPKVIEWRHDIHQNPELGNREFKTAELVADHLKSLGIKVLSFLIKSNIAYYLDKFFRRFAYQNMKNYHKFLTF